METDVRDYVRGLRSKRGRCNVVRDGNVLAIRDQALRHHSVLSPSARTSVRYPLSVSELGPPARPRGGVVVGIGLNVVHNPDCPGVSESSFSITDTTSTRPVVTPVDLCLYPYPCSSPGQLGCTHVPGSGGMCARHPRAAHTRCGDEGLLFFSCGSEWRLRATCRTGRWICI